MKYIVAYIVGGIISFAVVNQLVYPPPGLHGVQLGLVVAGIFLFGSVTAMAIVKVSEWETPWFK